MPTPATDALREAATVVSALPDDLVDAASTTSRSPPSTRSARACATGARCCGGVRRSRELKAQVLDKLLAAQQAPYYDVSVPGSPTYRTTP